MLSLKSCSRIQNILSILQEGLLLADHRRIQGLQEGRLSLIPTAAGEDMAADAFQARIHQR